MNNPLLLPELVELIVEQITVCEWPEYSYDRLQSCALISRTWIVPCQRALFRDISLYDYNRVVRFLPHLRRYPHLQNLIRYMKIWQTPPHSEARNDYLSCLVALFSLMPRLTYLCITFDKSRSWDTHDHQFIEAFRAFLHTSESLTELVVRNLRSDADFQQMFSYLEGTNVKRVVLYTEPYPRAIRFGWILAARQ
ncbi:hypothetical protein BDZ89DRAFT_602110 [Hymenopellis radicata]|nr:hypothetical protein BDZ89DRAFT_602110 [Hymenopellis radicata]